MSQAAILRMYYKWKVRKVIGAQEGKSGVAGDWWAGKRGVEREWGGSQVEAE